MLRVFLLGHLPGCDAGPNGHHVPPGLLLHFPRARLCCAAGLPVWLHPVSHGLPALGLSAGLHLLPYHQGFHIRCHHHHRLRADQEPPGTARYPETVSPASVSDLPQGRRDQGGRCRAGAGVHGAAAGAEADAGPRTPRAPRDAPGRAAQPRAGLDCHHSPQRPGRLLCCPGRILLRGDRIPAFHSNGEDHRGAPSSPDSALLSDHGQWDSFLHRDGLENHSPRPKTSQNNYRIDANQELLAIGLTNVLGSLVSSYPVTGSFGRTAVNAQSGVCTPAGGLVTGVLVLLSLDYLTSLFCYIPKSALAAVIITAVAPLFDTRIFGTLWRVKRLDLLPLCLTFLLCFWEVQYGILAGTLVSVLILLHSVARPKMQVSEGPVLVLQPASGLHFPAVEALREAFLTRALEASPPRCAVLECTHICSIDYTVVLGLEELVGDFHRHGVSLAFVGLQVPVLRVLLSADLKGVQYFSTLEEAEKYLRQEPGTQPYNVSEDSVPEHKIALLKA
nr:sodium-independent sulfate anion transporter isoform X2 [Neomonachus schauinslandi]